MAEPLSHKIGHLQVDFGLPDQRSERAAQQKLAELWRNQLGEAVEELLDEIIPQDEWITIPKLELDLGELAAGAWTEQYPERVIRSLREKLERALRGAAMDVVVERKPLHLSPDDAQNPLLHWLKTGGWREKQFQSPDVLRGTQTVADWIRSDPHALRLALEAHAEHPGFFRRLALLLDARGLQQVLNLFPGNWLILAPWVEQLKSKQSLASSWGLDATAWHHNLLVMALQSAVRQQASTPEEWLEEVIAELAMRQGKASADLRQEVLAQGDPELAQMLDRREDKTRFQTWNILFRFLLNGNPSPGEVDRRWTQLQAQWLSSDPEPRQLALKELFRLVNERFSHALHGDQLLQKQWAQLLAKTGHSPAKSQEKTPGEDLFVLFQGELASREGGRIWRFVLAQTDPHFSGRLTWLLRKWYPSLRQFVTPTGETSRPQFAWLTHWLDAVAGQEAASEQNPGSEGGAPFREEIKKWIYREGPAPAALASQFRHLIEKDGAAVRKWMLDAAKQLGQPRRWLNQVPEADLPLLSDLIWDAERYRVRQLVQEVLVLQDLFPELVEISTPPAAELFRWVIERALLSSQTRGQGTKLQVLLGQSLAAKKSLSLPGWLEKLTLEAKANSTILPPFVVQLLGKDLAEQQMNGTTSQVTDWQAKLPAELTAALAEALEKRQTSGEVAWPGWLLQTVERRISSGREATEEIVDWAGELWKLGGVRENETSMVASDSFHIAEWLPGFAQIGELPPEWGLEEARNSLVESLQKAPFQLRTALAQVSQPDHLERILSALPLELRHQLLAAVTEMDRSFWSGLASEVSEIERLSGTSGLEFSRNPQKLESLLLYRSLQHGHLPAHRKDEAIRDFVGTWNLKKAPALPREDWPNKFPRMAWALLEKWPPVLPENKVNASEFWEFLQGNTVKASSQDLQSWLQNCPNEDSGWWAHLRSAVGHHSMARTRMEQLLSEKLAVEWLARSGGNLPPHLREQVSGLVSLWSGQLSPGQVARSRLLNWLVSDIPQQPTAIVSWLRVLAKDTAMEPNQFLRETRLRLLESNRWTGTEASRWSLLSPLEEMVDELTPEISPKKDTPDQEQPDPGEYPKLWDRDELLLDILFPVPNAGIVLLWPYLGRFFELVQLMENGTFKDESSRERAIQLLHHLGGGGTAPGPDELSLSKILCGLRPVDELYLPPLELSPEETEMGSSLLKAVIGHWSSLGEVPPETLQEVFLMRPGGIGLTREGWHLRVEPGPYDMLLQTLPWTFSVVNLSWMDQTMTVDWDDKGL